MSEWDEIKTKNIKHLGDVLFIWYQWFVYQKLPSALPFWDCLFHEADGKKKQYDGTFPV